MDMETIVLLIVGASALVMAGVGVYIAGKPTNVGGMLEPPGAALTGIETCRGCSEGICSNGGTTLEDGQRLPKATASIGAGSPK